MLCQPCNCQELFAVPPILQLCHSTASGGVVLVPLLQLHSRLALPLCSCISYLSSLCLASCCQVESRRAAPSACGCACIRAPPFTGTGVPCFLVSLRPNQNIKTANCGLQASRPPLGGFGGCRPLRRGPGRLGLGRRPPLKLSQSSKLDAPRRSSGVKRPPAAAQLL